MNSISIIRPLFKATLALCLTIQTSSAATFEKFTYKDTGISITITGYPKSEVGAIVIPAAISGKPVTAIGYQAFYGCSNLISVTIPKSVTSIEYSAFGACNAMNAITVDALNPSYSSANGVLFDYQKTKIIQYPGGKNGSYTIPSSVTVVGIEAFAGCAGLSSVIIPNSVIRIADAAFEYCSGLTSLSLPNSITSIEFAVFGNCSGLKNVTIPNSVTSIGIGAFGHCSGLTKVTIPNSVTFIADYAFRECALLPSVSIPDSVTSIGFEAFSYCTLLTSVSLGTGVISIGDGAFRGATCLASISIPNGVTSIGNSVFDRCWGLTSVTIPNSVTSIGDDAFIACTAMTSLTIPNSITSIGKGAFSLCGLTNVIIPDSVTEIFDFAFVGCNKLTAITVDARNSSYSSANGVLFNKKKSKIIQCPAGKTGNYTIPNSVTSIGNGAFHGCTGLTSVSISNSVTSIGDFAFYVCTGLTGIFIPSNVVSIGYGAFFYCYVNSATFLGNAPTMGSSVFIDGVTVNYLRGKSGFSSPTWLGYPALATDTAPEIDIQQPLGSSLIDGSSKRSFGTIAVGMTSTNKIFTIKNTGTANLSGLVIAQDGVNAADFIVTAPAQILLTPGTSTTFKVAFKPTATGIRNAAIHIASNDMSENSFDIMLTGMGIP